MIFNGLVDIIRVQAQDAMLLASRRTNHFLTKLRREIIPA